MRPISRQNNSGYESSTSSNKKKSVAALVENARVLRYKSEMSDNRKMD
jgi:hypothetical protein